MNELSISFKRHYAILLFAILVSILLSAFISYNEDIINSDAICYLLSAQEIGRSGIHNAMHLCDQSKWPFYSALIYGLVKISHFSYPLAAYLINGFFSLLSVTFFILIIKELGASTRVLWLAAAVILLSHEFNAVRVYIIRDHGFWAFYLASVWCLLRYFTNLRWPMAIAWSVCLLVAAIFRIEGAMFLLLLPFCAFLNFRTVFSKRLQAFLILNLPLLFICCSLIAWMIFNSHHSLAQFGRLTEIQNQLQQGYAIIAERYLATKAALAQYILTRDSANEAGTLLPVFLFAWYFTAVINNVSWIYAFLVLFAWIGKATSFSKQATLVLFGYLSVNVIITASFLLERFFLSKRYLIALSLILMVWVPFGLEKIIRSKRVTMIFIVTIFLLISAVGGIFNFGYSKTYMREAANWLATYTPLHARLYSNSNQIMYYSHRFVGEDFFKKAKVFAKINSIANQGWKHYDYLALRVNKNEDPQVIAILNQIQLQPIKTFSNKRGDKVVIYNVNSIGEKAG